MNKWKENIVDPSPSKFNYPKSDYNSNQDYHLKNYYEFFEKSFFTSNVILFLNVVITKDISLLSFIYNLLLISSATELYKYFYNIKPNNFKTITNDPQFLMRLIGYGFQKYISTPSVFTKNVKYKYFPEHKIFNKNYTKIKKEVNQLLKYINHIPLTHDAIPYNEYISRDYDKDTGKGWKTLPLKLEGQLTRIGKLHCPLISELINISNIRNATISILEGKRHIPIHCGYFKGYIRYLFCVIEPKKNHSFIYINKKKYIFKENEGILWDDLFPHEVYNMSENIRVCIYLDILRELDNKLLNFIYKNIIKITKFSSEIKKMNNAYEKTPISMNDFPKYSSI